MAHGKVVSDLACSDFQSTDKVQARGDGGFVELKWEMGKVIEGMVWRGRFVCK